MPAPAGMWECPNCGRNIRDDWDSCPHCHTPKKGSKDDVQSLFDIPDSDNILKTSESWECPNCGSLNDNKHNFCRNCMKTRDQTKNTSTRRPPLNFSETLTPAATPNESKREHPNDTVEVYITEPSNTVGGSWAAKFLKFIAVLLIVLGIFVAWQAGNIEKTYDLYYSSRTVSEFSFWDFVLAYIPYLLGGAFSLCASELFENIQRIADSLSKMKTTKR